jgi:hypothetical protein
MRSSLTWALLTGNDRAASFAAIPCRRRLVVLHLVEFVTPYTRDLEAFRTKTVMQVLSRDGQVTMPATHRAFSSRQQFKSRVVARFHYLFCSTVGPLEVSDVELTRPQLTIAYCGDLLVGDWS